MGGGKGGGGGSGVSNIKRVGSDKGNSHPRPEGGGDISSPSTGPFGSGGGDPTKGYTGKMTEAMLSRAGKYGLYASPLGPTTTALAAAMGAYHEKSILDGEMSHRGRFGKPTIGVRPGGYKSLLSDDDNDSTSEGGGWGGWGGGIGEGKMDADDW